MSQSNLAHKGTVKLDYKNQITVTTGQCKAELKIFNQLYLTETYARAG